MYSHRFFYLLLLELVLFDFDNKLARIVHRAVVAETVTLTVHGVDILEGDDVVEFIDLFLDFPGVAFLGAELFRDQFSVGGDGLETFFLELAEELGQVLFVDV